MTYGALKKVLTKAHKSFKSPIFQSPGSELKLELSTPSTPRVGFSGKWYTLSYAVHPARHSSLQIAMTTSGIKFGRETHKCIVNKFLFNFRNYFCHSLFKGEVQQWVRWRFSNLIILWDRRELIIRIDKVPYFTRGSKVSLRKIAPETAKISRNIDPNNAWVSPSRRRTNRNSRNSNLPTDTVAPWLASEPGQSPAICPAQPYMYTERLLLIYSTTVRAL